MQKHILLFLLILFTASLNSYAQPHHQGEKESRIRAARVAFITDKLELTPEEAQKFWPVYNEFDKKRQELQRDIAERFSHRPPDVANMSDAEAEEFIIRKFDEEKALVELKIEYFGKIKEVLPVKKILLLYESEMEFRKVLLERLKDRPAQERR